MAGRRLLVTLAGVSPALLALARSEAHGMERDSKERGIDGATARMPAVFAAHGAPVLLDDAAWMAEPHGWAKEVPRPRSVLTVSARREKRPATLGATTTVPLVAMYPGADVPALQLSIPGLVPDELVAPGRALAPLLAAARAAADGSPKATFPITGWWMDGAFTKRPVRYD